MELRLMRESQRLSNVPLRDGETLTVAPLCPTDEPRLRDWFRRVSADSRSHVTARDDAQWQDDGIEHIALVASIDRDVVGVARLIALPGDAEVAFLVDDDHQRRGIGTALRDALLQIARERGIYRLHAHVRPDNTAIRRLLDTPALELVGDRGHVLEMVFAEQADEIAS
jgi:RimJ/RimL family protein N-acetyltransferase